MAVLPKEPSRKIKTCFSSALEVIFGLTPMHLIIDRVSKETIMRMSISTRKKGLQIDPKDSKLILKYNPKLGACRDDIETKFSFDKYFNRS